MDYNEDRGNRKIFQLHTSKIFNFYFLSCQDSAKMDEQADRFRDDGESEISRNLS